MSTTAPIERLNYFNGQRLEAADFRIEQDFHMRVRRLLTQSLFTPGIAAGLAVEEGLPKPSHTVQVLPGVALDSLGREIILVEPREVPVAGKPTEATDPVTGNYLIIEYAEVATAFAGDGCAVQLGVTFKATEDLAWGAPSRIRAEPHIYIQHQWPKLEDNKIVLAQLALNKDCSVREIRTFVRKYVAAAKEAKARAFTLEGEKDLDPANSKELYFQIGAEVPNTAVLILRGERFSTLFYTELGGHTHSVTVDVAEVTQDFAHTHTLKDSETDNPGDHGHALNMDSDNDGVDNDSTSTQSMKPIQPGGNHTHKLTKLELEKALGQLKHKHPATGSASQAGVSDLAARTGLTLKYVNDLKIAFDGADITSLVLTQLNDRDGLNAWTKLGDGSAAHKLCLKSASEGVAGTGEIDLLRLGIDLHPGDHRFTFTVASGGGRIQYNLLVA
jgi:hypothetical protein